MTYKILDTCCFVSFFSDVSSCNMRAVCHEYKMPITNHVASELSKQESIHIPKGFEPIKLEDLDTHSLFTEIRNTFPGLGPGEVSAFTLAACLNERTDEQIVMVTDDKKALRKLSLFRAQETVLNRYPNLKNVILVRPVDMIRHLFSKGYMDQVMLSQIISELEPDKISGISDLKAI